MAELPACGFGYNNLAICVFNVIRELTDFQMRLFNFTEKTGGIFELNDVVLMGVVEADKTAEAAWRRLHSPYFSMGGVSLIMAKMREKINRNDEYDKTILLIAPILSS